MWVNVLTQEMEMLDHMKELLTEGSCKVRDDGKNKVQCIDGKIRMTNFRNRESRK